MFLKAIRCPTILILLACLALFGCSTGQSRVWKKENTSFKSYEVLELRPVFNATGGDLKQDITNTLSNLLWTELKDRQFQVAKHSKTHQVALVVKSSIVTYQGCELIKGTPTTGLSGISGPVSTSKPMGKSMCTVQTQLIDKVSGQIVAKIFTTKTVGACYTDQYKNPWLLKALAVDIAKEIATIMKA